MSPMLSRCMTRCTILVAAILILSGCYGKPVRNLASDAALIKAGQSTREDVLTYLGEPDDTQAVAGGIEKWLYKEKTPTTLEKAPVVGKYFGTPGVGRVVVTLKGDRVIDCVYDAHDDDDTDWADDFPWQNEEKK